MKLSKGYNETKLGLPTAISVEVASWSSTSSSEGSVSRNSLKASEDRKPL